MKSAIAIAAVAMLAAAGCQNQNKPSSALQPTPAVTEVSPSPAMQPAPVAPEATAAAPIDTYTPAAGSEATVATPASYASAAGSGKYTVKKGDTLYRIAATHYGDGKQWTKIVAANQGVSPAHLRVGQVLTLP